MFCKNCGHKIEEGKRFCKNCGIETHHSHPTTAATTIAPIIANASKWVRGLDKSWLTGIGVVVLIVLAIVLYSGKGGSQNVQQSVVDVNCDNGKGGSGTIFTSDGTVLTNNHVITGAQTCRITIPDPTTGGISEIYEAAPIVVSKLSEKYDVATLKIDAAYTDSDGKTWGTYPTTFQTFTLPKKCDPSSPSKLGDSVRIYGYPVTSGGYNLTITDGVISSFTDDGYLLTSAQIDSGNSGGLAVDQNGCWLGIPSAVVPGNYQTLGVIIPGSIVETYFLNSVPAKLNPAVTNASSDTSAETAATPQETNAQKCQSEYGTYSEWSGQMDSKGKPTCGCQSGYAWDATGNACASQTSLQRECKSNYGSASYSHTQGGKAVCDCSTGYVWNSDQTACVVPQLTNDQVCQGTFGANSEWSGSISSTGKPTCVCQSGYSWDGSGNACASQAWLNQSCTDSYGIESYSYTQGGKATCGCQSGYTWNTGQTACVASLTPTQICQRDVGAGSYYLGYKNSDGTYACSSPY